VSGRDFSAISCSANEAGNLSKSNKSFAVMIAQQASELFEAKIDRESSAKIDN
jgi:hypothetical protein